MLCCPEGPDLWSIEAVQSYATNHNANGTSYECLPVDSIWNEMDMMLGWTRYGIWLSINRGDLGKPPPPSPWSMAPWHDHPKAQWWALNSLTNLSIIAFSPFSYQLVGPYQGPTHQIKIIILPFIWPRHFLNSQINTHAVHTAELSQMWLCFVHSNATNKKSL